MARSEARRFLETGMAVENLRERFSGLGPRSTVSDVEEILVCAAREGGFDFTLPELKAERHIDWGGIL